MKTCIIIDDEQKAREILQKMLQRYFSKRIEVLAMADSVKQAVALINEHKPDLVFLDIEMPEENGLQLFSYFKVHNFDVIFTTAYEQYAINAIKFAALDYILKPINQIELGDAITKLEKKDRINKNTSLHIENLLHNLNLNSDDFNKIVLPTIDGYELVKIRNIIYCKADGNYCDIYTVTNEIISISKPLKFVEDLLPKNSFFRPHKSFLINLNYIKSISRSNGGEIVLDNGKTIPIAGSQFKKLMEQVHK
jgi:two-component system LytT family response regulator